MESKLKDQIRDRKKTKFETYQVELMEMSILYKYIAASKIINRYLKILENRSLAIAKASRMKNMNAISDLSPYFEGVIWSANRLNIKQFHEFDRFIRS